MLKIRKGKTKRWLNGLSFIIGLALVSEIALAVPLPATGPDAFGYSGTPIASNLRDISTTGTFLALSDDQVSGAIGLGFGFDFYGISYSQTFVSSNGFLSFDSFVSQGCCSGLPLPQNDSVNNVIAGLWEDLNAPQGNIRYQTLGSAGNRQFVVGFYNVLHFFNRNPVTFEMILHEGTNNIEFQYGALSTDGGTHTVGIENASGTIGLQVYRGSILDFGNSGYLIGTGSVPEPTSLALLGLGLAGLGFMRRRRTWSPAILKQHQ